MVNQYDFKTGTKGVISGSKKLKVDTSKIVAAETMVAASPPKDLLVNNKPARVDVRQYRSLIHSHCSRVPFLKHTSVIPSLVYEI